MILNFEATDEQLIAAGMNPQRLRIANMRFEPAFHTTPLYHFNAVWDAWDEREMYALAVNNPGVPVRFPAHAPRMGFVPAIK